MLMANNTNDSSVPAWKLPLLERRRQQAEMERLSIAEESTRLAQMPAWKREVYLKKRSQQKDEGKPVEDVTAAGGIARTQAFLISQEPTTDIDRSRDIDGKSRNRNPPPGEYDYSVVSDTDLIETGRLLPIQRNPILQSDLQRRAPASSNPTLNVKSASDSAKGLATTCAGNGYVTGSDLRPICGCVNPNSDRDSDEQDEVAYGRGFVSKLLGRFRELTEKNHYKNMTSGIPKRTYSSDNLLSDVDDASSRKMMGSSLKYSKGKAQSMDNLSLTISDTVQPKSPTIRPVGVANGFVPAISPTARHTSERTVGSNKHSSKSGEAVGGGTRGSSPGLVVPAEVVRESSPLPEDELPRSNIVLLTRTVFESIATLPQNELPNSKKKKVPTATLR